MKNEQDFYCSRCLQDRQAKHFTKWNEDRNKARHCDFCNDDITAKAMASNRKAETAAKRVAMKEKLTPIQAGYAGSKASISKLRTRRAIEEYNESRLLDSEFEL
jgi:hypothetical protein